MSGVAGLRDRAELHLGGDRGYAGLNPIGPGLANVSLVVSDWSPEVISRNTAEFFLQSLRRFPGIGNRLHGAVLQSPVRAAGPFDVRSRKASVPGGLLVGDAAEFFDPFTGEGIHAALRGAELASEAIAAAVEHRTRSGTAGTSPIPVLPDYLRARRLAFWGKWIVERMIGYGMSAPGLFDRAIGRIGRRPPMAHTMIGVTGHFVPPTAVLNPVYLTRMVF